MRICTIICSVDEDAVLLLYHSLMFLLVRGSVVVFESKLNRESAWHGSMMTGVGVATQRLQFNY